MLILTMVMFFLAENGKINNFPTYLAAIGIIPFILIRPGAFASFNKWTTGLIVIFLLYLSLSSLWVESASLSQTGKYLGYGFLLAAFVLGIPLMSSQFPDFLKWFLAVLVLAATVSCIYSIYLYHSLPDYHPLDEERLYALGRLRNPVIAALSYGVVATISLNLIFSNKGMIRWLWGFCLGVLLLGILLTESRGVWAGLLVSIPCTVLLQQNFSGRTKAVILFSLMAAAVTVSLMTWLGGYWDEVLLRSTSFRPEIWTRSVQLTMESNLMVGHGAPAGSELLIDGTVHKHAHSIYFATFFYGGIIGLILLLSLLAASFGALFRMGAGQKVILAVTTLLYSVIVLIFDGDRLLEKVDFMWVVFWLPIALGLAATLKENGGNYSSSSYSR
jgi:putative inorganic carbon (hco3(-)) transporter